MNSTAKVVEADGAQMILLPEGFRFDVSELLVRRQGDSVVLSAVAVPCHDLVPARYSDTSAVFTEACDIMSGETQSEGRKKSWDEFAATLEPEPGFLSEREFNIIEEEEERELF